MRSFSSREGYSNERGRGNLMGDVGRECAIRDAYADQLARFRPHERLISKESTFEGTRVRADMKTVDRSNVLRIWEFKIRAGHAGLGQILTYLAMERLSSPNRRVRPVLAAFEINTEITQANEMLNLGIEMLVLPRILRRGGDAPAIDIDIIEIPPILISQLNLEI
jgi:hypothetical protein